MNMIRGHTAIDTAATIPHKQVNFVLPKQAKRVSPTYMAKKKMIAIRTSTDSRYCVNPATTQVQHSVMAASMTMFLEVILTS